LSRVAIYCRERLAGAPLQLAPHERGFAKSIREWNNPVKGLQDRTSMDRILFAVFTHENKSQGVSTPFLLTQNN